MGIREFRHGERQVVSTAEMASDYVRRMVRAESQGWGDQCNALGRIGMRYNIPFWSLDNLRTGRAKTVEAGLFGKIRRAYLDVCERQVKALQQEIAVEKALTSDDSLDDLEAEAAALASRIAAKRKSLAV